MKRAQTTGRCVGREHQSASIRAIRGREGGRRRWCCLNRRAAAINPQSPEWEPEVRGAGRHRRTLRLGRSGRGFPTLRAGTDRFLVGSPAKAILRNSLDQIALRLPSVHTPRQVGPRSVSPYESAGGRICRPASQRPVVSTCGRSPRFGWVCRSRASRRPTGASRLIRYEAGENSCSTAMRRAASWRQIGRERASFDGTT